MDSSFFLGTPCIIVIYLNLGYNIAIYLNVGTLIIDAINVKIQLSPWHFRIN
jgi:hypothetical protein